MLNMTRVKLSVLGGAEADEILYVLLLFFGGEKHAPSVSPDIRTCKSR